MAESPAGPNYYDYLGINADMSAAAVQAAVDAKLEAIRFGLESPDREVALQNLLEVASVLTDTERRFHYDQSLIQQIEEVDAPLAVAAPSSLWPKALICGLSVVAAVGVVLIALLFWNDGEADERSNAVAVLPPQPAPVAPVAPAQDETAQLRDEVAELRRRLEASEADDAAKPPVIEPDPVVQVPVEPVPPELNLVELGELVEPAIVRIETPTAMGSGFLLDKLGTVVTNHHVVENALSATAQLANGTVVDVDGFIGVVPGNDIAILRINLPADYVFTPLSLAASPAKKGESVVAYGAPEGLNLTPSQGIVSGLRTGEEIKATTGQSVQATGQDLASTWLQITAPISHGSSGGPVVSLTGAVFGITSWSLANEGAQNLNFAVPADEIVNALPKDDAAPILPLAALPALKRRKPVVAPVANAQDLDRQALQKLLVKIDQERVVILAKKMVLDDRLSDLRQQCDLASAAYNSAAVSAANALAADNALRQQAANVESRMKWTFDQYEYQQYQMQYQVLLGQLDVAAAQYAQAASTAAAALTIYNGLLREYQIAEGQMLQLYIQANGLLHEFLMATGLFGHWERRHYDFVKEIITEWALRTPDSADAKALRAIVNVQIGAMDEARQDFELALKIDRNCIMGRLAAAYFYYRLGKLRDAETSVNLAINGAPGFGWAHYVRGKIRFAAKKVSTAEDDFKRCVELSPECAWGHQELAVMYAANWVERRRNAQLAMEHAQLANELTKGKNWACLDALAMAHAEAGDSSTALTVIEDALRLAPDDATKAELRERAALYANGQAYHMEMPKL